MSDVTDFYTDVLYNGKPRPYADVRLAPLMAYFQCLSISAYSALGLQIVAPAVAFAWDLYIMVQTLRKCTRHTYDMRQIGRPSHTQLLLRDG